MRLYSTLQRGLVALPPPEAGPVRMYFCGPTVYQRAHIGNARPFVLGMWLRSWLKQRGYDVTLVHNITDVNDKIYDAAPGASAELAARATEWYLQDTADLGLGMPDGLPLATEHIPGIIRFIEELLDAGYAYAVEGDVYFRVARDPEYGRLSGQRPDQMEQGEEPSLLKDDPRDFALWKANKPGEDTAWDAPWGRGRPGWHIECSSMVRKLLGDSIDIHGGGIDLIFPHHENEIAQCEAFTEKPYVKYWLHNGFIEIAGQKMSKSLGNIWKAKHALADFRPEVLRYFFLSAHYRSGLNYDRPILEAAARGWEEFNQTFQRIEDALKAPDDNQGVANLLEIRLAVDEVETKFKEAMDDDFNTPKALAALFDLAREVRRVLSQPG